MSLTLSPGWIRGTRSYPGSERWRTATWELAIHGNRVHEPVIRAPTAQLRTSLGHRPSHCSLMARVNPRRSGPGVEPRAGTSRGVSPPHPTAMAANPLQCDRRLNPLVSWTVGAWHDSGLRSGDRQQLTGGERGPKRCRMGRNQAAGGVLASFDGFASQDVAGAFDTRLSTQSRPMVDRVRLLPTEFFPWLSCRQLRFPRQASAFRSGPRNWTLPPTTA